MRFFSWIVGLGTAAAAIAPFATDADMSSKVATGIINLVIGIAILQPGQCGGSIGRLSSEHELS